MSNLWLALVALWVLLELRDTPRPGQLRRTATPLDPPKASHPTTIRDVRGF